MTMPPLPPDVPDDPDDPDPTLAEPEVVRHEINDGQTDPNPAD